MGFKLANVNGRAALVNGAHYFDLETVSGGALPSDPMAAVGMSMALSEMSAKLDGKQPTGKLVDVELGPPVPRPPNVYAVGLNYRNHAEESNMAIPAVPMVFTKHSTCIVGPTATIELRSDDVDYEGELVAVIGKGGKGISREDAWDHVAGLCVGQDISDRPTQMSSAPPQFNLGKSFDTYGPIGPVLTSPEKVDLKSGRQLQCKVSGDLRQDDNTDDLIFDIPRIIEYLSDILTLQVGDVIFTGTPGGVGGVSGNFLKDGDMLTTTIEGLGTLSNPCARVADHANAQDLPKPFLAMLEQLLGKEAVEKALARKAK